MSPLLLAEAANGSTGVSAGGVAAMIALSNIVTAGAAAAGVWYLNYRKQRQEFRQQDRAEDRLDRDVAVKEWERLVGLYGVRIAALEQNYRDTQERLVQCEESEKACQRMLRKYEVKLRLANLWSDSDYYEPQSPIPRPPRPPESSK